MINDINDNNDNHDNIYNSDINIIYHTIINDMKQDIFELCYFIKDILYNNIDSVFLDKIINKIYATVDITYKELSKKYLISKINKYNTVILLQHILSNNNISVNMSTCSICLDINTNPDNIQMTNCCNAVFH